MSHPGKSCCSLIPRAAWEVSRGLDKHSRLRQLAYSSSEEGDSACLPATHQLLLVPQRLNRVDVRRPARRNPRCQQRHQRQTQGRNHVGSRVRRADSEEK